MSTTREWTNPFTSRCGPLGFAGVLLFSLREGLAFWFFSFSHSTFKILLADEHIPLAPDGFNETGMLGIIFQFLTQAAHVDVYGP